jgi:uncharacterized protein DUF5681
MPKKRSKPRKPRKPRGNPPPAPQSPANGPSLLTAGQSAPLDKNGKPVPPQLLANQFPPGTSGNPSGRPRKISDPLEEFLAGEVPNDPEKRTYLKVLIEAAVKRAITKSDALVQEIFNRVEGKISQAEDEKAVAGMKVILIDVPRPDRSVINVTPQRAIAAGGNGAAPAPPVDPRPKD